jgi:hypothetical protein
MREEAIMHERNVFPVLASVAAFLWLLALAPGATAIPRALPVSEETLACRALEVHTSEQPAVTLVIFHQREKKDSERLGALLREYAQGPVEFQTADGAWHSATVTRLRTCFGRGLLLFPAGSARLAEKDVFVLRFPSK